MPKPIDAGPPHAATVVTRTQESPTIFTLRLRLDDPAAQAAYRFAPGQFNMLYLYGVGEVPISIMSDPEERDGIGHLGIGSPSGDDQAGWLVVDALQAAGLEEGDIDKLDRPGASLIPLLAGVSRLILIDAMLCGAAARWAISAASTRKTGRPMARACRVTASARCRPGSTCTALNIGTACLSETATAPVRQAARQLAREIAATLALSTPSR